MKTHRLSESAISTVCQKQGIFHYGPPDFIITFKKQEKYYVTEIDTNVTCVKCIRRMVGVKPMKRYRITRMGLLRG